MLTALAVLLKFPFRPHYATSVLFTSTAKGFHFDGFTIQWIHLGLIVKGVNLTRPSIHKEKYNMLRLCGQWRILGCQRIGPWSFPISGQRLISEKPVLGHQPRQGKGSEPTPYLIKKFTARGLSAEGVYWFFIFRHKPVILLGLPC